MFWGGSWVVGLTNSIGGADVENIFKRLVQLSVAEIICWGFWNILWEYISFVLHPCNISFLTQASSPIHFCSKSRLPTRSKGRERYPAAILKRLLGKASLDGQQAHTDGTVHVLYMSIVGTIKNVPLCKSGVEFVTAFSPFALFFCVHQSYFGIQICWPRSDVNPEHTYLARRSTMIMKVVPLGWGLSIAHRLGWPLRLPQTWVTRARNFW